MEKIEKEEKINLEVEDEEKNQKMSKKCNTLKTVKRIVFLLIILSMMIVAKDIKQSKPIITRDMLIRNCSDIYQKLSVYPDYNTTYISEIPKFMSEDITEMFESDNPDFVVMYYLNNKESYIMIEKSKNTSTGYEIVVYDSTLNYGINSTTIYEYISMYVDKSNKDIIITGTAFAQSRQLKTIEVDWKNSSYDIIDNEFKKISSDYIDLYGTNQEFDDVRERINATMIRNGREFKIYSFGEQLGETVVFPGEEIKFFDYRYILDSNNDLYYLYMNTDKDNTWIKFIKVAENVDQIVEDDTYANGINCYDENLLIKYPEYIKNGKTYSAITSLKTEEDYGQRWYGIYSGKSEQDVNFNFKTIETDINKAQTVTFGLTYYGLGGYDYWYEKFEFENVTTEGVVYKQKRLNGLDTYLTKSIPNEIIEPYNSLKVPIEEEETIKNQLKEIYKKYE